MRVSSSLSAMIPSISSLRDSAIAGRCSGSGCRTSAGSPAV